jgi:hypothetical protein
MWCYQQQLKEYMGNIIGNKWEHGGNILIIWQGHENLKQHSPKRKILGLCRCMLSYFIDCMKFFIIKTLCQHFLRKFPLLRRWVFGEYYNSGIYKTTICIWLIESKFSCKCWIKVCWDSKIPYTTKLTNFKLCISSWPTTQLVAKIGNAFKKW